VRCDILYVCSDQGDSFLRVLRSLEMGGGWTKSPKQGEPLPGESSHNPPGISGIVGYVGYTDISRGGGTIN
jgi:hypothetical protein